MAITFRYDAAGVVPPSNESTRKYGQSLVLQQQQQKYAGQQAGYDRMFRAGSQLQQQGFLSDRDMQEQRSRDFESARSRLDTYARDMLANGEVTDPEARRKIQSLIAGKAVVMGSGFDQTARQEYLDQYNSQLAGILSGVPVKQKPTRDDELKAFLGSNYHNYKHQPWVPDGKGGGGFTIADIPQPAQPAQSVQQPRSFGEYAQAEPDKARAALANAISTIEQSVSDGLTTIPEGKTVEDMAIEQLDRPFQVLQKRFGQAVPSQPGAQATPAPMTGASMTQGARGNMDFDIARPSGPPAQPTGQLDAQGYAIMSDGSKADPRDKYAMQGRGNDDLLRATHPDGSQRQAGGRGFTYQGTPEVNSYRGAQQPVNDWAAAIEEQIASRGMNQQQIGAMNAETDASLANTNALLADNQARGRAVADQYAPRTEGLRRDANVLQGRNARAESALRGELGPRSPGIDPSGPYSRDSQGKLYDGRVNRIYDISDEQDKRDQIVLDAMQADGDAYRARRDQRDAALQNRATNPIANPKQLKRDSAKFSADFQIYKKGGGSLSIRDYINQRAKQGTLSDDLKAQLQENYGMNLADEYVSQAVEQDLNGPRENAMAAAKSKRDAEENRKRRARGLPPIRQAPPVAVPDMTRPTRGLPGGNPTAPSQIYVDAVEQDVIDADMTRPTRGLPGGDPARPTQKYVTEANDHLIKQSGLPQAWKPNWSKLAEEATDFDDRAMIQQVRVLASQGHPADVMNAFYVFVNPSASKEEKQKADDYLLSKGIDLAEVASMRPDPVSPDRGVMRGSGIKGY